MAMPPRTMSRCTLAVLAASLVTLAWAAQSTATTYTVAPDSSGDYPTIQAALNAASDYDIIELTAGTFLGEGNRDLDYLGKAVTVRSQSANPESTIIDCEGMSPGFRFHLGEGSESALEGVTITGGIATVGGGIYCENGSPTITDCIISNCGAGTGGGGLGCENTSSPLVTGCTFYNNYGYHGGGAYFTDSPRAQLANCTFYGNSCGTSYYGSGICLWAGDPVITVENTIIAFGGSGGAVSCGVDTSLVLSCCDIYGNADGDWVGCIAGQYGANGNISRDPRFCSPDGDVFTLFDTSPCAPDYNPGCGLIGAWPVACSSSVYVVNPQGTGDFPTIQEAINAANDYDIIELTTGTFTGEGNRNVDYVGLAVTVRSQSANPESTIIDCERACPGFHFHMWENQESLLEGVTVTNGVATIGGGIYCERGSPTIDNCIISDCGAGSGGGGIGCENTSSPLVTGCTFYNNYGYKGGGAYFTGAPRAHFAGCTFYGNSAAVSGFGSGICLFGGDPVITVENTIIAGGGTGGAVSCSVDTSLVLTCCDLYGNDDGDWIDCIAGQYGANGNVAEDPRFCRPDSADFTLNDTSPCAPGNNPGCGLIGAWPVGCSASVYVVNPQGTGDFPTIQAAINAADNYDIIELTAGTFTGVGNRDLDYLGKAVTVRSQSANPENTVIDCESACPGFHFQMGEGPESVLEGVTITNGIGTIGGGIRCEDGSPTIENCIIWNCGAETGGGGLGCENTSSPLVSGCIFYNNYAYKGGGAYFTGFLQAHLANCTFYGNRAFVGGFGSGICLWGGEPFVTAENTIIAFGGTGGAVDCTVESSLLLTCCDLFGNAEGDWIGCIEGQEHQVGNMSENPLFCDPGNGVFTLDATSPCAAVNNPYCDLIGARDVGCEFQITSIADIGHDQGGQVRLEWWRCPQDAPATPDTITHYSVWRRVDQYLTEGSSAGRPAARGIAAFPPGDWDFVKMVPAYGEANYRTVCETLCDSTIAEGMCWSIFFVRAGTADPLTYYDCAPDSGYSLDNLEPSPPAGLVAAAGAGGVDLAWEPNEEEDLDYYAVYRDTSEDFIPGTPIGYAVTEEYEDHDLPGPGLYWYKVTAVDFSGNESDPSLPASAGNTDVAGGGAKVPSVFFLGPAVPNPFNPVTEISYGIPAGAEPSRVVLAVYDPSGRRVCTLVDADREPGTYRAVWKGTDHRGRPAASGVYFYRLTWNDRIETQRMVLVK